MAELKPHQERLLFLCFTYSRVVHILIPSGPPLWCRADKFNWKLNDSLLTNPNVLEELIKEIESYFETNASDSVYPSIIWAAHKAGGGGGVKTIPRSNS